MFGRGPNREKRRANTAKRAERLEAARQKGTHTALEWEVLKKVLGPACVRCGEDGWKLEKDHIIPIYQGGSDSIDNIQPICAPCNVGKGPENIDHRDTFYPRWREHYRCVFDLLSARFVGKSS